MCFHLNECTHKNQLLYTFWNTDKANCLRRKCTKGGVDKANSLSV